MNKQQKENAEKAYDVSNAIVQNIYLGSALLESKKRKTERASIIWATFLDCTFYTIFNYYELSEFGEKLLKELVEKKSLFCDNFSVDDGTLHIAKNLAINFQDKFSLKIVELTTSYIKEVVKTGESKKVTFIYGLVSSNEDFEHLPLAKLGGGGRKENLTLSSQPPKSESKLGRLFKNLYSNLFDEEIAKNITNHNLSEENNNPKKEFKNPWVVSSDTSKDIQENPKESQETSGHWKQLVTKQIKYFASNTNQFDLTFKMHAAVIIYLVATYNEFHKHDFSNNNALKKVLEFLSNDSELKGIYIPYNQSILFAQQKLENKDAPTHFIFSEAKKVIKKPFEKTSILKILQSEILRW